MNKLVLIIAFLCSVALFSCKPKPVPPAPPVPVNVDTVKAERVTYYDKYPSTTEALSQVDIRPEVQGYITGIYFKEGSHVKKGQKLYEIDQRLYQQNYEAAVANLKVAQSTQLQNQQDADRYEYLNKYDAIAKQVLDHAVIALQSSKDQVAAAVQAVNTAKTNFIYSTITAPFDGTIGFSQVKLGNMVTVGTTILNTISTDNPMAVDFLVNEAQLMHYQDLISGKKHIDSLFTILMPDYSLYGHQGQISIIDRAVDPQTGTVRIRLVFPNPDLYLRVGMSCTVRVHNQEDTPQMVIPNRAIVEQMGEYFVFTVKDTAIAPPDSSKIKKEAKAQQKGTQNKASDEGAKKDKEEKADSANAKPGLYAFQKKVQLGMAIGPNIIIKSGISPGDVVVVDGVQTLHEGSRVTTANKVPPTSGNSPGTASPKNGKKPGAEDDKKQSK